MPLAACEVSGLVLAGGRGLRMQGVEKGLLNLHGRPLVAWALQALPTSRAHTFISANRHQHVYADYGRVVGDDPSLGEQAGPLQGIASVLQQCPTPWLMVVPVDVPVVPAHLFERLAQSVTTPGRASLAYARTRRPQPLFMLLHTRLVPELREYLLAGERRVHTWQQKHGEAIAFADSPLEFANINTPAELRHISMQMLTAGLVRQT